MPIPSLSQEFENGQTLTVSCRISPPMQRYEGEPETREIDLLISVDGARRVMLARFDHYEFDGPFTEQHLGKAFAAFFSDAVHGGQLTRGGFKHAYPQLFEENWQHRRELWKRLRRAGLDLMLITEMI